VLDDTQHAAGLQRGMHCFECFALPAEHHPVVQVAEGHDHVRGTGRRNLVAGWRRGERGHDDGAVEIGTRSELRPEVIDRLASVLARCRIEIGGIEASAVFEERREELCVSAACGPHFDNCHVGTRAEELQRRIDGSVAGTLRGAAARQQAGSGYEQRRESHNHFHRSPALR
jgi:hypothetical protein